MLLDLQRSLNADGRAYRPGSGAAFSVADLERARERSRVAYSPGCVVLLRTGFLGWYCSQPWRTRARIARGLRAPGVEHTEKMARYLWDSGAMAVASDTFAVEVWPRT